MKDRQVIEWDKDDIDALKFMKVDCLALGMMSCMKRGLDLLKAHKGIDLDLATIPAEDPRTYAMIRKADTLGVFQIESRAQMAMLPRIKPRTFYDLVIEVAIVRPGPDPGRHGPSLSAPARGQGARGLSPSPSWRRCWARPWACRSSRNRPCGWPSSAPASPPARPTSCAAPWRPSSTPAGSAVSRTSWSAAWSSAATTAEFAEKTFSQLEGFGSYGFPESHAASFALIAYASSWLKCHHPDVFCAALLNAQPMGFYAPAQIVRDAQRARRRGPAGLRQRVALGLHAGAHRSSGAVRGAARPAQVRGLCQRRRRRDRARPRRAGLRLGRRRSGGAPACRPPAWSRSPRPTASGHP